MALPLLTSEESHHRNDNVFIWRTIPDQCRIVFSWRVDADLPMTHKTMYRWLSQAAEEYFTYIASDAPQLFISPVHVIRGDMPLTYDVDRMKDRESGNPTLPLERDSLAILEPGSYGIYTANGEPPADPFNCMPQRSIYRFKSGLNYSDALASQSIVSENLRLQASIRDGRRCCLTGVEMAESDLGVTYIIPPWLAYLTKDRDDDIRVNMTYKTPIRTPPDVAESVRVLDNCLTMSKVAIPLFEKSIIAIDVDDNYRIVRFYEGKRVDAALKNPLNSLYKPNGDKADEFLRAHFRYSLSVQVFGGDYQDVTPIFAVRDFMTDMKLFEDNGVEFSLKGEDFTTEEWQSEIGQHVLAWFRGEPHKPWKTKYLEGFGIAPAPE